MGLGAEAVIWAALAVLAAVGLYWLLVASEGTYLGPRIVAALYDWTASRYDAIKQNQFIDEQLFIGAPVAQRLEHLERPRVLDVATGTGRVPMALVQTEHFYGEVLAGDRSAGMLREAQGALEAWKGQVTLVRMDAADLPVADESVDCVTCLEALEFMTDGRRVLRGIWRSLRPGGIVLITNRVGAEALLYPFRIAGRGRLERALRDLGFDDVETQVWQVYYDLVWARKPLEPTQP